MDVLPETPGVLLGRLRRRGRARRAGLAGAAEQHCGEEEARPKAMHARSVTGRQVACKQRPNRVVGVADRDFPEVPDLQRPERSAGVIGANPRPK